MCNTMNNTLRPFDNADMPRHGMGLASTKPDQSLGATVQKWTSSACSTLSHADSFSSQHDNFWVPSIA